MSITEVKGCCPLDGQDGCSWIAQVEDGRGRQGSRLSPALEFFETLIKT